MNPEMNPMDPDLERAISEIRDEPVDSAVVEGAAARVWARLAREAEAAAGAATEPALHIRNCADFQALIPDYRVGRLPEARAMLLQDHLHQCVECRKVYEGRVVAFPARKAPAPKTPRYALRWAAAAAVVAAAGASIWFAVDRYGAHSGRAYVQAVNGALYEITSAGIRPLAAGQDLPGGAEIRTAKDSGATVELWDGSRVELRERSALSTSQSGPDITVRVNRGTILVQAAKRRSGHLYVATDDCRVAVTGTVFAVNAGVKGSRVSVLRGEVRVDQGNQEKVLHPGDQSVSGPNLERNPIPAEISWSRDGESLSVGLAQPGLGKVSPLLDRAPSSTVLIAIIPNASDSLTSAADALRKAVAQNPELRGWFSSREAGIEPLLARLKTATGYLDQVAMIVTQGSGKEPAAPVFLASVKRPGLGQLLKGSGAPIPVEERPGLAVFGPQREAVEAFAGSLGGPKGGFQSSPCYARLVEAERHGAGAALCADLAHFGQAPQGARYFMAAERQVNGLQESRATLGFDGPRTGIAAWLAPPAPMGSLDYVSPDATFLAAFVVKSPAAIVDETLALRQGSKADVQKALALTRQQTGIDVRGDLAASLGGEFALALDGPVFPTPSWKLIAEVYDPARFRATIQRLVQYYNQQAAKSGRKPLRTGQETVNGRTYYMIGAAEPNPLTEAHYTFSDGYLIAGPSSAILTQALRAKAARTSIVRSTQFVSLMPRDSYANFSAVVYQNLGTTLAPLAGLLGSFTPPGAAGRGGSVPDLGKLKPSFVAAYGEPDRITIASYSNMLGLSLSNMTNGSLLGIAGGAFPIGQLQGTRGRQPAFR